MKRLFLLTLASFIIFSCSEDEVDNSQSLENATLSLADEEQVIEVPQGLQTSDNIHAAQANTWVQTANAMSSYLGYFEIPEGAEKTSEPIIATNSRASLTAEEYLVYKWTHPNSDYGVAYQVSQEVDRFIFEVYFKFPDDPNWYKYIEAEEMKDNSSGSFIVYDSFSKESTELYRYIWERNDDTFNFTIENSSSSFEIALTVNQSTGAGEVKYYSEDTLDAYMTWDAQGSGSWKEYDSEGNVSDEGSWTA